MALSRLNLRTISLLAWAGLLGWFLVTSAPRVFRLVAAGNVEPANAFHSTDSYLAALAGMPNGSARVTKAVAALSAGKPVAVFIPEGEAQAAFVAAIVSYLSWPAEVRGMTVTEKTLERRLRELNPANLGAVIFLEMTPPSWMPAGVRLGPQMRIIPLGQPGGAQP